MTPHVVPQTMGVTRSRRSTGARALRFISDRFLLLPIGAVIAQVWVHTAPEAYFRFAHALAFPVNEIGMAIFLGLMAQELIEAVIPGGALHTWRRWAMPLVAAAGGLAGAVFTYFTYVQWAHEEVLSQAWPVVVTIDVAAGYYVARAIWHRGQALSFLLLLAMATNVAALIVLATRTPFVEGRLVGAILLLVAVGLAAMLRRSRVHSFWPYFAVCGTLSWLAFYLAEVHTALALIPIVPFLPHQPRPRDVFAEPRADSPVHRVEREWHTVVQIVVLLFGLVNAGVIIRAYDTGTWAIVVASLVGRPLGILAAVGIGLLSGLTLPSRVGWRDLMIVALVTSSGFTFALFVATGVLPTGAVLTQVKIGALATSAGALLAFGAARLLGAGRFASTRRSL
jgi:Na+:H+ antiporter, NhaA family